MIQTSANLTFKSHNKEENIYVTPFIFIYTFIYQLFKVSLLVTLASSVQLTVRYKVPDDPNMSSRRAKVKGTVVFFHDKEKSVFIKPILLHVSLPAHTYCPEVAQIQRTVGENSSGCISTDCK